MSSFVVPVFAENGESTGTSIQNLSVDLKDVLGPVGILSSVNNTTDYEVPEEYKYMIVTRYHNNSGNPLNGGIGHMYFKSPPKLQFNEASNSYVLDLKPCEFYYASYTLKTDGTLKFNYFNYMNKVGWTVYVCDSTFKFKIKDLISWDDSSDIDYLGYVLLFTNFKIVYSDITLPDFNIDQEPDTDIPDYNKVDGYDESIFDKMPILDFSNCETPLDYIKTFFTWVWDMILWSVQLVKDFFKMLHNINTFITNFISNFVKQIVNTVKEIANKFIDTLIERVKDITNAVAEVVLEFLKKWFIPSEEFLNEHYSTLDKTLKGKIGDYSSVVEIFNNFFANLSGSRYRSAFASAPIIEGEYKGVTLAIDFSFLDPYIENIRLFIGGIMCVAQTWWFIRHLPSLIGRVPAANTKSYEPEKSSDSDSKSNKGG